MFNSPMLIALSTESGDVSLGFFVVNKTDSFRRICNGDSNVATQDAVLVRTLSYKMRVGVKSLHFSATKLNTDRAHLPLRSTSHPQV